MKNKIFIILFNVFLLCMLLNNVIIPVEKNDKNYSREAEQSEKELRELNKKGERYSYKNHELDSRHEYTANKTVIEHIFIISHTIIYQDTSFSRYCLWKELPKRAPPVEI
ncbi:MAG: hypothetical protein ABIH89_08550 [Elusimicrobiota bacterium]